MKSSQLQRVPSDQFTQAKLLREMGIGYRSLKEASQKGGDFGSKERRRKSFLPSQKWLFAMKESEKNIAHINTIMNKGKLKSLANDIEGYLNSMRFIGLSVERVTVTKTQYKMIMDAVQPKNKKKVPTNLKLMYKGVEVVT